MTTGGVSIPERGPQRWAKLALPKEWRHPRSCKEALVQEGGGIFWIQARPLKVNAVMRLQRPLVQVRQHPVKNHWGADLLTKASESGPSGSCISTVENSMSGLDEPGFVEDPSAHDTPAPCSDSFAIAGASSHSHVPSSDGDARGGAHAMQPAAYGVLQGQFMHSLVL